MNTITEVVIEETIGIRIMKEVRVGLDVTHMVFQQNQDCYCYIGEY